jgi:hypothetical protein
MIEWTKYHRFSSDSLLKKLVRVGTIELAVLVATPVNVAGFVTIVVESRVK